MPVPSTINDLALTAIANSPQGTEAAKGTIDNYLRAQASFIAQINAGLVTPAEAYGAVASASVNVSSIITTTLAITGHVSINKPGTYRCDTMIELNTNQSLTLGPGVVLQRYSASSASTDPVVWIKGSNAAFKGAGQGISGVFSQNRSPKGVVRLGHKDMTESHASVTYCTLKDMYISGALDYGQTTGDPDVSLYIPSPQFSSRANYFHNISGLRVQSANIGIWLHGWANANTINNIQGYRLGNLTLGVNKNVFIYCNGALDNAISNCFFHQSASSIGLLVDDFDNTGAGGVLHSVYANSWAGMVFEQGGVSAIGLKSIITTGNSYYEVRANTALGNSYPAGFLDANILVDLNALRTANVDGGVIAARTSLTAPAATFSTTADVTGTLRTGQSDGLYLARKAKRVAQGANAATLTFTLSNNVQASLNRIGYIRIIASGGDRSGSAQFTAWYVYGATALGTAFPTLGTLKDSGGDVASFTISAVSGVLTVASTQDDIVVEVEYGFTNPNVNVT